MTHIPHWSVQRQAADCLGVSERTLHRWRSAGLLKPGEHFRRKFPSWLTDTSARPVATERVSPEWVGREP